MNNFPKHIGVILDGNRRWAKERGLSTEKGHMEGFNKVEELLENCKKLNIKYLTVYAFSTENFKRSELELKALFMIFESAFKKYHKRAIKENIKITIFGDRTKFNNNIIKLCDKIEEETKDNNSFYFNICLNYGGRAEIVRATKELAKLVKNADISIDDINEELFSKYLYSANVPDPDFIIRTSGEQRLSNFLTWQSTYCELYFTKTYWPDFGYDELVIACQEYERRNRRFGGN